MDQETPVYVTVEEAAEVLKVNKRHIKRMIMAKKLSAKDISVGQGLRKQYRVLYSDLLKMKNG